ncbi:Nitrilase and fragile histidine triad fusion protein [Schistosoma japonicum]|uniref:bis(5'-adenosyl)-triphosphatase n=3 Tax=Schistosoma japonicum TaxID=6182 RepID=A0A4Z2CLX3_SCHJA|nr:Nitrilase and fragile histidine triad fusion protein NitFhit [Schistosoma japonicum]TNN05269.1 Nitrilase and fragile histidine triad fusion protein [Schistosoma japonicum]
MRHILRKAYFIGKLREKLQYNMTTKIGVIQMQSTANKEWNFNQAVKYINKAIASGVKIVFLPECFDFVVLSHKETLNLAEVLKGPLVTRYCSLAARENLWISLGGAHIKSSDNDDQIYNSHIVINSDGQIVGVYHKVHLFDANLNAEEITTPNIKSTCTQSFCESKVTRSGMEAPNVIENTPIGNLGLAICYDLRFPELASYLRYARNAHVIAYPSAFSTRTGESGHWHTLLRARAIENQCYIVASAQEGKHNEKRSSYGHSLVVDPWGQIIAEQLNPGPGLLTCEIGPFTMTNSATSSIPYIYHVRRSIPVEYHRRFDLFPMSDSGYPRSIQSADFNFGPHIIKSDCVFYQSQLSFAFVNISPLVPGHVLVCPIVCVQRFCHLNPAQIADLYMTVRQVAKRLAEYFSATSLTISIQDGKDAGQSVAHVHVHILPRKPNDFPENDDIYKALQKHDKLKSRVCRSHDVMSQEAKQLRQLYYPNNLKSSIFSQNC